jgi:hypothetical protein
MLDAGRGRPVLVRVFVFVAVAAALSSPARAQEPTRDDAPIIGISTSAQKAVADMLAATASPAGRATRLEMRAQADPGSSSFFKTRAGIITLVAIGAAAVYTVYSTAHDRVRSPGR